MDIFTPILNCPTVDCVLNIIKQFHYHKITYREAEEIIYLLSEQIKYQKEIYGNMLFKIDDTIVHDETTLHNGIA